MMQTRQSAALLAAFGAAFFMTACAGMTVASFATDADDIATGLAAAAADLRQANLLTADQLTRMDSALSIVQAAAGAVAKAANVQAAQPEVAQLVAGVNAMVGALSTLPTLPAPVPEILTAANVMLPVLESAVGLSAPVAAGAGMPIPAGAAGMTPAEAEAVLAEQAQMFRHGG